MTTKQVQYVLTKDGSNLFTDVRTNLELVHHLQEIIYYDGSEFMVDKVDVANEAVYVYVTKIR